MTTAEAWFDQHLKNLNSLYQYRSLGYSRACLISNAQYVIAAAVESVEMRKAHGE